LAEGRDTGGAIGDVPMAVEDEMTRADPTVGGLAGCEGREQGGELRGHEDSDVGPV
jgi:hypothetical protein